MIKKECLRNNAIRCNLGQGRGVIRPSLVVFACTSLWVLFKPEAKVGISDGASGPRITDFLGEGVFQRHHRECCAGLPYECCHVLRL